MLIRVADWERIRSGEVTLQFRRWKRPTVRAGGTLRTSLGVLAIDAVDVVSRVTRAEAVAAGFPTVAALKSSVDGREGALHRIRLRCLVEDPRIELRSSSDVEGLELSGDAVALLRLIAANPAVRATESLEVGYASPRGERRTCEPSTRART
ncbi:hypothetical protein [Lentzea sp. HUAS12]|uniref:hypothetical protein n=1 Tax=Lentzea sp. HUAS12 TaxID=2951806 RepID=UPI00209F8DD3|nr:hypothetical protein [Lentzea sp. HUAS12]USX51911.1 hypothetical protein ND450_42390 [Lentzea sp. HUAS12]